MAIIGVSGRKRSGKDTVARMIDELTPHKWEFRKFAATLKNIVCLLINCTLEQLEDPVFKEIPLGEEWTVWYITTNDGTKVTGLYVSEGDLLMDAAEKGFVLPNRNFAVVEENLTPRRLLQLIGTELFRTHLHENVWVISLMGQYVRQLYYVCPPSTALTLEVEAVTVHEYPDWLITDVRFPNEADAIKSKEGILIRVERPIEVEVEDLHESETALDNYEDFDYIIYNDGNLEDLKIKIYELCVTMGLIHHPV